MVILRSQNKITDFFMILAWASPLKCLRYHIYMIDNKFICENIQSNPLSGIFQFLIPKMKICEPHTGVKADDYFAVHISDINHHIMLCICCTLA